MNAPESTAAAQRTKVGVIESQQTSTAYGVKVVDPVQKAMREYWEWRQSAAAKGSTCSEDKAVFDGLVASKREARTDRLTWMEALAYDLISKDSLSGLLSNPVAPPCSQ